jgi:NAD(P)-dependent dehydrogenase (short-subunit alcohol dehydrogenase family)
MVLQLRLRLKLLSQIQNCRERFTRLQKRSRRLGEQRFRSSAIYEMSAQIAAAVQQAADSMGGIDIVINNASAINLTRTEETSSETF